MVKHMIYTAKTFNVSKLEGISEKQMNVHLALYEGYVTHVNLIREKLAAVRSGELSLDSYVASELRRRFAFEFNGMRLHEYYFEQLEVGHQEPAPKSALTKAAAEKYGSHENFITHIKDVARSRGIGWVMVYEDTRVSSPLGELHTTFVSDHEVGHLAGLPVIFALDLWEHAYMVDYVPAEKKRYIDAFFANVNWGVLETRFENATKARIA